MKKFVTIIIAIMISLCAVQSTFAKGELTIGIGIGSMSIKSGMINDAIDDMLSIDNYDGPDKDVFLAALKAKSLNYKIAGYIDITDKFTLAGDMSSYRPGINEYRTSALNLFELDENWNNILDIVPVMDNIADLSVFALFENMNDFSLYGRYKVLDNGKSSISVQAGANYSNYNVQISALNGMVAIGRGIKLDSMFLGLGVYLETQPISKLSLYADVKVPLTEMFILTVPVPSDVAGLFGFSQDMTDAVSIRRDMKFVGAFMVDVKAGVKYEIAPNINLGIEGRITNMNSVRAIEAISGAVATADGKTDIKMWTPTLTMTLGYSF